MRTAAGKRRDSGRWKVSFPIGQESSKIDNLTWFQARWFQEYAVWFLGIARNRNRPKEPDRPVEPGRFLRAWFHEYAVPYGATMLVPRIVTRLTLVTQ